MDDAGPPLALPFFATPVQAGFPSPADDHQEDRLDLNRLLVRHPEAIEAKPGMIVVAAVDNEFTVKLLEATPSGFCLAPANPHYAKIILKDAQELVLWGVVIHVIHSVHPRG
ncbi:MAG: hypothetical protein B7Y21_13715 [Hydrogenophilales bacterium 16-61-112]|nr:MAG: hypothetical protein B7Y21_13715 [Hydrogenophilales bacterium 16-61-112]